MSFSSLVPAGGVCTFGGHSWNYFRCCNRFCFENNPFGNDEWIYLAERVTMVLLPQPDLCRKWYIHAPQSGTSGNWKSVN